MEPNATLAYALDIPLVIYVAACQYLRLPLYRYMRNYLGKLTADKRRLVIYDQLNPEWAKYYKRDEAERLLTDAGFRSSLRTIVVVTVRHFSEQGPIKKPN